MAVDFKLYALSFPAHRRIINKQQKHTAYSLTFIAPLKKHMKKILFSLCAIALLASCKKKEAPEKEASISPVAAITDTLTLDTINFNQDNEVHDIAKNTTNTSTSSGNLNENDKYFVVVGSFETKRRANAYIAQLEENGQTGFIVQRSQGPHSENYRIAVQSSNDRQEALQAAENRRAEHPEAWVLVK